MSITAPPIVATITSALTDAGVGAFWDSAEGWLIAHPVTTDPSDAYDGEHVMVHWDDTVPSITLEEKASLEATVWVPDGAPDYARIANIYTSPDGRPIAEEAAQCARAVAEWFAGPRLTAGDVLMAALAEYGITQENGLSLLYNDHSDSCSVLLPLPGDTYARLVIADRDGSLRHLPKAHTGWSVILHDELWGEPVGDPVYITGDGGPVDCAEDSAAAAAFIADFVTAPISRHCDCPAKADHDRHAHTCNRYRRP
ncbi:hypothetical protein [Streptomyces coeruleorubidus]|uniref:hypothetical protein n=1 Tax=Streptomyces coeruleorubidus TaxID=116188 RepID=UPI0033B9297E